MRVINLTHGPGNGVDRACLMTATNMLRGRGQEGDSHDSCVCIVLRQFVIITNDFIPERLLGKYYGDLPWEIIGTYTNDPEVLVQRANCMKKWATRFAARAARSAKWAARAAKCAAASAGYAAKSAAHAAESAESAAHAAESAEYAAGAAKPAEDIYQMCADCIREVAAIGDTRPKEPQCIMTRDQLCDALER